MGSAVAIAEVPVSNLPLLGSAALAAIVVLGYMVNRLRSGRAEMTVVDALILAVVVAILGATGVPLLETASERAKESTLVQNLRTLRSQIELYKVEHGGKPPVLFEGRFPQLLRPTDGAGETGPSGSKFPYGPYLQTGVPVNPITGRSIVTPTDTFPPTKTSGNGGWLYHQPTGQIAVDLEGFLDQ